MSQKRIERETGISRYSFKSWAEDSGRIGFREVTVRERQPRPLAVSAELSRPVEIRLSSGAAISGLSVDELAVFLRGGLLS